MPSNRNRPTEETIFTAALEKETPAERASLLDEACAGNPALRRRVEALLGSHAAASFLGIPAVQRAVDAPPINGADDTRTGSSLLDTDEGLDFLVPSNTPGSIGRLGHYEVQEVVGRGGMGVVLKAFDETLHRVVAVKVMAPQLATSATARRRFAREARAAAAVSHDHVVTIHAVEDTGPLPSIVMQYVAGSSLQERLDRTGPLPLAEVLRIGMQTASGLAAAHAQGLVHRDVKPANILLENGVERVKLTDFGLARAADDASLTQSGAVAGTPSFMSPEQAEGKPVDHRSDLFSLGSVLYAMCTGRLPFRAGTSMAVLRRVCEDTPSPIREINPEVPDWLAALVEKLHAKDPAARYQSAEEVAELLGQHLAHVQHPSVVPLPAMVNSAIEHSPARNQRRNRWAVAATVLAAVFAALGTAEAMGVTQIRATVLRTFNPEGTLVVETDDPGVKVTGDAPAAAMPTAERGAFVLLGGKEVAERKFDTLAEAVFGSADGDTIEVRGNGPFVTDHIRTRHALIIRAGAGFRPVITDSPSAPLQEGPLFGTDAELKLEGLELRCERMRSIIQSIEPLAAANCRFLCLLRASSCLVTSNARIRNCEVLSPNGANFAADCSRDGIHDVANCVLVGRLNLTEYDLKRGADFRFTGNTFVSPTNSIWVHIFNTRIEDPDPKRVRLHAAHNVFSSASPTYNFFQYAAIEPHLSFADAEAWMPRRMEWREEHNHYHVRTSGLITINSNGVDRMTNHTSLAKWDAFWGLKGTASSEGVVKFKGGDLFTRGAANAGTLAPDDFRLSEGSPGYRARKDGKDLGADVDLVGPGAAYERWKKTPEYQQWLKETERLKK